MRRGLVILATLQTCSLPAHAEETLRLKEGFPAGYQYHVSSRVDLSGTLTVPANMAKDKEAKPLSISGESAVEYDERVLDGDAKGPVQRALRLYSRLDFRRKVGDKPQESTLRPEVRRLVLLRLKQSEVPFSPDGPLTWAEIDLVRTDVFTPALQGLLPEKEVRVGDSWSATQPAIEELTDLDQIEQGKLDCKFQEITVRNGRRFARVEFTGTITGINEDGPNRQQLEGYFFFDLQSNHLSYLYLNGTSWLLDKDGKSLGKIEGRYVLTRKLEPSKDLGDEVVRKLTLEPNDDNTLLLFSEPALGVQFVYPRRWTIVRADARQIALEEPRGGGLLITLEPPKQIPTGAQFQTEAQAWLQKQSAKITRTGTPRKLANSNDAIEHFDLEAELDKQKVLLDYFVVSQSAGGATFAGRFPASDADALHKDAERIARSLKLVPPKR